MTVSAVQRSFTRLAVVNRGEAAMRAIHAVRELGRIVPATALVEAVERGMRRTLEPVAAGDGRTR